MYTSFEYWWTNYVDGNFAFTCNSGLISNGLFILAGDIEKERIADSQIPMSITNDLTKHNDLTAHLILNSKIVAEEDGFWQNYW